jgi:YjbE family integral membrane protein
LRISIVQLPHSIFGPIARDENRSMQILSPEFLSALAAIVVIDLALAGDNAIVIALAARGLPREVARRAIAWGTAGAIVVRALMTAVVVWLLAIPGLMAAGGLVLVWIAYKLAAPNRGQTTVSEQEGHFPDPRRPGSVPGLAPNFWQAMKTIVVADAAMGLDNVLAVAGAAQGSFLLVVLGLAISIPIVIWGSTLLLSWIERMPWLVHVGVAVLAWTAAKMIVDEPLFAGYFASSRGVAYAVYMAVIGGVFGAAFVVSRRRRPAAA